LKETLEKGFDALTSGGRFAIISFHSGEDRIVKTIFGIRRTPARQRSSRRNQSCRVKQKSEKNPRSRSAQLRIIEKK